MAARGASDGEHEAARPPAGPPARRIGPRPRAAEATHRDEEAPTAMARPYLAMVDYGTGNVHSLGKALERVGCSVRLTRDPDELGRAAGIVLPGVGAFGPAWRRLEATGLVPVLRGLVAAGRPLLGICLGMQLLFEGSREDGEWPGLGFFPGRAEPFAPGPATAPSAPRTPVASPPEPGRGRVALVAGDGGAADRPDATAGGGHAPPGQGDAPPAGSGGRRDGPVAGEGHPGVPGPPGGGPAQAAGAGPGQPRGATAVQAAGAAASQPGGATAVQAAGAGASQLGGAMAAQPAGVGPVHPARAAATRPARTGAAAPLKVPHMGWNRVAVPAGSRLLAGLGEGFYAYFVHSYRVPWPLAPARPRPRPDGAWGDAPGRAAAQGSAHGDEPAGPLVALADYGGPFVAAIEWGPVAGTQFHPEKSGPVGLKILRNFGAMCGACDPGP